MVAFGLLLHRISCTERNAVVCGKNHTAGRRGSVLSCLSVKRPRLLKKLVAAVGWAVARKDDLSVTFIMHDLASRNEVNEGLLPHSLQG